MLPLSQIFALQQTVDRECRFPVADAVGECWGLPAGALRFWRAGRGIPERIAYPHKCPRRLAETGAFRC
jgi:hypothetical protein